MEVNTFDEFDHPVTLLYVATEGQPVFNWYWNSAVFPAAAQEAYWKGNTYIIITVSA